MYRQFKYDTIEELSIGRLQRTVQKICNTQKLL